ncbi:putative dehydrogenase [Kibdelosporangium banguiense]|uniref:Dehydrogenase n=1 Tax=Kibdelosporangium banguiense TaxID=1365924 RepID=A0ABS4U1H2_9PSEU|nr:Gfo/Idh/MocA family oxidoreductase [Kibdelosporangium banguiense]MBP2330498.1 putative dehydrogenase [Kibdelosporangium banguiense]
MTNVVLIGAHGHGRVHLADLLARDHAGLLSLRGIADLRQPEPLPGIVFDTDAVRLMDRLRPDVVVIATPMHTHAELASHAMSSGAHVLLEKPPVTTLADHEHLLDVAARTRRHCQVGFQAFGSSVVRELISRVRAGELGDVRRISVAGCWYRDSAYYSRSAWAGRRAYGDGALANPFAHGLAIALRLAAPDPGTSLSMRAEPYRAYQIGTDDTMSARIDASTGVSVTVAVTLCARYEFEPYVKVFGSRGQATLWYTKDLLRVGSEEIAGDRVALIDDLITNLDADPGQDVLCSPLRAAYCFTSALAAIQDRPGEHAIPERYQRITPTGRTVAGIEDAVVAATEQGLLFSELNLPWAVKELT